MRKLSDIREKLKKGKDDPCWKDYVQVGMKKKGGKEVPNCVPKESANEEKDTHKTKDGRTAKKGLWYNINQKKKRGEAPAKKGDPDYPKTLDIEEKAVSQAQQKMMGMALAYKRGEMDDASPEVKKMANSMSMKDLEDFAKTKHKGLPVKKESVDLDEAFTPKEIKMAIGVASDKRYAGGNMTGAVNAIEKIKKGLSNHPQVKAVLRRQNESLDEASYPLAKKWQSGAKMVKSGKLEFVRGSGGVHSIKMNGKSIGNFSLDDDAGMWVANLNGVRGQLTVDEIDDLAKEIPKRVQKESVELGEALQSVTKIKFDYKDTMPKDPKPSDVGGLKQDWNNDRMTVRDAIKPLGGLVTDSEAPSRANKFVGTLSIGTRGDASKLSNSAIQKAVKSKGAEIQNNQFMSESVELDESEFTIKVPKGGKGGKDYVTKVSGKDRKSVVAKWRKENPKFKNDTIDVQQLATLKKKGDKYSFSKESVELGEAMGPLSFHDLRSSLVEARGSNYEVYHKDFSTAVQYAKKEVEKKGYEIDDDEWFRKVASGPRKPSKGKTNSYNIELMKSGKPVKQRLQMQVFGMDSGKYELNMYVS